MVVDDSPANLKLLGGLFRENGYHVRPFTQGALALRAAENEAPDLFLLDINMPEIDGYELCRRLKASPALKDIPVIFLSTLQDLGDKVKAFECGAVDYVTKQPFHFEEILARVGTHLRLRELQRALEQRNTELRNNIEQLKRLEEMKESLTHMIVHDMRSPLTVVMMAIDMLKREGTSVPPEDQSNMVAAYKAASTVVDMTNLLLDISRLESGKMPIDKQVQEISLLARGCIDSLSILLRPFDAGIEKVDDLYLANCDCGIIRRVINNLLGNAAKFTPPEGHITISLTREPGFIRVTVQDSGPGIPEEEQSLVFEKFGQGATGKKAQGTGLGLTFCKLAVEAHGGRIGVHSSPGKGAAFWFTLPEASVA
jgi:signal transduction histidine kinase